MQKDSDNGRERACKACEGTGSQNPRFRHRGGETAWRESRAGQACLACIGTGRVTERIPASDAIADAETLRRNSRLPGSGPRFHWDVFDAENMAAWSFVTERVNGIVTGHPAALAAARAAFRAVPGLRS